MDDLLHLVREALPVGYTAEVVPVPEGIHAGTQIAISRRHS